MLDNEITGNIVSSAIEVHRALGGPGLVESVYEQALIWELEARGLEVGQQVMVPIGYKGRTLGNPLRLDLIVEKRVIVEVKATTNYSTLFEAQALTYLRLTGLKIALVINFGAHRVIDGVHRVVNGV